MQNEVPIIGSIQKIVLYETKQRFYVVGSNNTETRFRVLKIDRTEPHILHVVDDQIEYTQKQIRDMLMMIDYGNRPKQQSKKTAGLCITVSAFGIVGFVRFLEGYYIILITKRRKVALIGTHTIYKVEDTSMIYIPNDSFSCPHPDESKYVKMFQNIDLSSNFYYSYSYDLTHTLQFNLSPSKNIEPRVKQSEFCNSGVKFWQKHTEDPGTYPGSSVDEGDVEDASKSVACFHNITQQPRDDKATDEEEPLSPDGGTANGKKSDPVYGTRTEPTRKYVWNNHLIKHLENMVHPDWILYITHGFLGQSNINIFGKSIYMTLIARRSNRFAGTRFLKRGANCEGDVANEVETEQIVQDVSTLNFRKRRHFTSFVQHRGSVPLFWSQDVTKMVPKPPIGVDQRDPYSYASGVHFNEMLRRYGAPVIVLNLVKKREKKKHESILTEEFVEAIQYLNQFLPPEFAINYTGFDMARVNKSKNSNVLARLAEIADVVVKKIGFFHTAPPDNTECRSECTSSDIVHKQHGVLRTNCVDCLDRTNTAQFVVGKCALALQLHALNVLETPELRFDSDCTRMLEELYEDHGDTLALQYGGSQLVHRIQTYRKISPWTSHSRDIMQTLSRYYSNTFSDADKQHAINLFLGVFEPSEKKPNIWEFPTDMYLHNHVAMGKPILRKKCYSQWWDSEIMSHLPAAYEEETKGVSQKQWVIRTDPEDERTDGFWDYYKPYELTNLEELYSMCMPNSISIKSGAGQKRDFMPKNSQDHSPFAVRVQVGRRQEESGFGVIPELLLSRSIRWETVPHKLLSRQAPQPKRASITEIAKRRSSLADNKNPNVSGKDSASSIAGSEVSTSSSNESDIDGDIEIVRSVNAGTGDSPTGFVSLQDLFPTMKQTYGVEIQEPDKRSLFFYKKYTSIGENSCKPPETVNGKRVVSKGITLIHKSSFNLDSSYNVTPPTVTRQSKEIYRQYVAMGLGRPQVVSKRNHQIYQQFVRNKYQ
ncbi:polyphosphoinositide phosphatase-like isoform X3 [Lineus longissimus]|uniref:polyphosphoinositide phosphatase-like isoform X3 n=1 Tax=Lineus longissimus TaxID=88925 RepID=UPI00315D52B8